MPRASTFSAVIAVAVTAVATGARAQAQEPVSILVEGSIPCTNETDFFARVHRRAPGARSGQPGEPTRTFSISVEGLAPSMHGRLSVVHLDGRSSTRDVDGESCEDVVDALALITAVDIDPDAVRASPNARPAETIVPAASAKEPSPPLLVAPATAEKWHVSLGIEPSVTARVAPQPLYGLPIFIELASPSPSLLSPSFELGFERTFNSTTQDAVGDAVFDLVEGFFKRARSPTARRECELAPACDSMLDFFRLPGKAAKSLANRTARIGRVVRARAGGPRHLPARWAGVRRCTTWLGNPAAGTTSSQFDPDTSLGQVKPWNWRAGIGIGCTIFVMGFRIAVHCVIER